MANPPTAASINPAHGRRYARIVVFLLAAAVVLLATLVFRDFHRAAAPAFGRDAEYHAVLLTNGQAYFGKIVRLGPDYVVLSDVYYVTTQVSPDTKQTSNILIKRGKELHAPDRMMLNIQHILMVEPVTPGSQIARLISEFKRE